ncbi:uncharacterized protein LOC126900865 [Daktulosphaira vitifoliae]|uniref:uncharacterized protein LOC126900865 n=1 Tax=Daktulosphaira vitifoliae TaxID=58002 RepID=UPI0021AA7C9E|nr:uncharacterized protein LOC126900865 [Daktulosphaira vitifoliae]
MTVTIRRKQGEVHSPCLSVLSDNSISKRKSSGPDFNTCTDSCCSGEEQEILQCSPPLSLRTPADSTASWLDAEDEYKNGNNFLEEATIILYGEGDFCDPCHDKLREEYKQWKRIPHLRITGRRIDYPCKSENYHENGYTSSEIKRNNEYKLDDTKQRLNNLQNQVVSILMDSILSRVLVRHSSSNSLINSSYSNHKERKDSTLTSLRSPYGIESSLVVSPILPADRQKPKSNNKLRILQENFHHQRITEIHQKPWPKNNVSILPPIDIHPKKITMKTKRWFSAIAAPSKTRELSRPATSAIELLESPVEETSIDLCVDISIDGKRIKGLQKKCYDKYYNANNNNSHYRLSTTWPRRPK